MDIISQLNGFKRSRPVDIEAAIRSFGLELRTDADLPPGISGHLRRLGDVDRFEIATSRMDHRTRQRFTMAHELGHFVLHRGLIGTGVDDDIKYRSNGDNGLYNSRIQLVHERQANSFAASLLMPEELLLSFLERHPAITMKKLADAFEVSQSAMGWRLKVLGIHQPTLLDP